MLLRRRTTTLQYRPVGDEYHFKYIHWRVVERDKKYIHLCIYVTDTEGFNYVTSFDNYEWKDIDWTKDMQNKNTLIVTSSNNVPSNVGILDRFFYPTVPIVLSVKEQILQYPSQEPAYVLIESK